MKKEIVYYKVRVDGIDIPSSFIMNRACYQSFDEAIEYINNGWSEFADDRYLNRFGRKIINDYIRHDVIGYLRQITIRSDNSFVQVVTLAVDRHILILR